jgi:hypothetical protein
MKIEIIKADVPVNVIAFAEESRNYYYVPCVMGVDKDKEKYTAYEER